MKRYGWLANVAIATVVRRLTYLALAAVLAYFSVGKAHAQSGYNRSFSEAMSECNAYTPGVYPGAVCTDHPYPPDYSAVSSGYVDGRLNGSRVGPFWEYRKDPTCPTGQQIDPATHTCKTMPTPEECLARNDDAKKSNTIVFSGTACIDNCSYGPTKPPITRLINGTTYRSGEMGYTGDVCNVAPPTPKPDPSLPPSALCAPIQGQTVCMQPDGKLCYTGSSITSMTCWQPGETGEKTDGPQKHVVAPGTNPGTPSPPLPGDTQSPTGTPTTITTTGPNGTATTTHTVTTTGSGNNAGPRNAGEPIGGTKGPDGKDESKGTATGGGSCTTAPTCSGDAIFCSINHQSWLSRCATDATITSEAPGNGGEDVAPTGVITEGPDIGGEGLDNNGFGWSRACPTIGTFDVFGKTYSFDESGALCGWLEIGGALVMLFAAMAAMRILAGAV
jgi:hypothetical protein